MFSRLFRSAWAAGPRAPTLLLPFLSGLLLCVSAPAHAQVQPPAGAVPTFDLTPSLVTAQQTIVGILTQAQPLLFGILALLVAVGLVMKIMNRMVGGGNG